jgi:NAD(P)-dependent dehydrogenase (short-subunit alcohol dehydrogenase family)
MRFASKIAVITGGGTGIGRAAAEALVHEGAKVVINGRRENVLAATAKAIDPSGRSVAAHAGDIGRPETAAAIVSLAQQRWRRRHSHEQRGDLRTEALHGSHRGRL